MSADALSAAVTFEGGTLADFLRGLEGRLGVNVGANVGHCAVRRFVMGDDASERAATDDEIVEMQVLVREALAQGAVGFTVRSTLPRRSRRPSNRDTDGSRRPVLGKTGRGSIGSSPTFSRATPATTALIRG
jgi:N-acyl-D-aspartate/D-glutamate deacylase